MDKDVRVFSDAGQASRSAAFYIANEVSENPASAIALAFGNTYVEIYKTLTDMYYGNQVSFRSAKTFQLDEYCLEDSSNQKSGLSFIKESLLNHVDINHNNTHFLNTSDQICFYEDIAEDEANAYERLIKHTGGLDLVTLGIGVDGHIGFNETGSKWTTKTRMVTLSVSTREAAAGSFGGYDNVPRSAMTMGIETIMSAKKILLVATGAKKAAAVKASLEGEPSIEMPASVLRFHPNVVYMLDADASRLLSG